MPMPRSVDKAAAAARHVPREARKAADYPHRFTDLRSGLGIVLARNFFHLHLISDATGETLIAVSRAVIAQYDAVESIEHLYPFVRSAAQLEKAIAEIDEAPGVVLFTLVDKDLAQRLVAACHEINVPCHSVLQPISDIFRAYLGSPGAARPGAQHMLNAYYFNRVEALNYTMLHDDGQTADDYEAADILLLGVSRTSKTPTSIYLANRGYKTANIPIVPNVPLPKAIFRLQKPLIVGLITSAERLVAVRQQRLELFADAVRFHLCRSGRGQ